MNNKSKVTMSKSKITQKPKKSAEISMMQEEKSPNHWNPNAMQVSQDRIPTSSTVAVSTNTVELMELIHLEKKLRANTEGLSLRLRKLIEKTEGGDIDVFTEKVKRTYGVSKAGELYKCLLNGAGKIIKGSYRACAGKSLQDIATLEQGNKNGKLWASWRNNKTRDFVRGTFKWLTQEEEL